MRKIATRESKEIDVSEINDSHFVGLCLMTEIKRK